MPEKKKKPVKKTTAKKTTAKKRAAVVVLDSFDAVIKGKTIHIDIVKPSDVEFRQYLSLSFENIGNDDADWEEGSELIAMVCFHKGKKLFKSGSVVSDSFDKPAHLFLAHTLSSDAMGIQDLLNIMYERAGIKKP